MTLTPRLSRGDVLADRGGNSRHKVLVVAANDEWRHIANGIHSRVTDGARAMVAKMCERRHVRAATIGFGLGAGE